MTYDLWKKWCCQKPNLGTKDHVISLSLRFLELFNQSTSLQLHSGTKSNITKRLEATSLRVASPTFAIVIELSSTIKSKHSVTFPAVYHFSDIVHKSISYRFFGYEQCDVVADQYFAGSLKERTVKINKEMIAVQCSLLVILGFCPTSTISSATFQIKITLVSFSLKSYYYFMLTTLP